MIALLDGKSAVMVGIHAGEVVYIPLHETWEKKKDVSLEMRELAKTLAM